MNIGRASESIYLVGSTSHRGSEGNFTPNEQAGREVDPTARIAITVSVTG